MAVQYYGWIPDQPDHRDHYYRVTNPTVSYPRHVNLIPGCPPVYDQGALGRCTGNAIAGAVEFSRRKQKLLDFIPSRLFIYYNERVIENTVQRDSGAQIRDGIKAVVQHGACSESIWTYDIARFAVKPSVMAYQAAMTDLVKTYRRINQDMQRMRGCLARGYPFVIGISVYESFESETVANTGVVPMPGQSEQLLGGHAVLCVGYNDHYKRFLVRNRWGTSWGLPNNPGYFTLPYDYLMNSDLRRDFWVINRVG